jgi:hypothetical protein
MNDRSILIAVSLSEIDLILEAFHFIETAYALGKEEIELCKYLRLQLESFKEKE